MAVSLSARLAAGSTTGALSSDSIGPLTVAAGDRLVCVWGLARNASGAADWGASTVVTDSRGLPWDVRTVCSYSLPGGAWDVCVVVAVATSDGTATTVTVTPPAGVTLYSAVREAWAASDSDGLSASTVGRAALADGALSLALPSMPDAGSLRLVARYWSAGGGSATTPTLAMGSGWSESGEVYSPSDYAGSLAVWQSADVSAAVEVADTWIGAGSTYGGALMAVVLGPAPSPTTEEPTVSHYPYRSSAVVVTIAPGATLDVIATYGRPAVAIAATAVTGVTLGVTTVGGAAMTVSLFPAGFSLPVATVTNPGVPVPSPRSCVLWFE